MAMNHKTNCLFVWVTSCYYGIKTDKLIDKNFMSQSMLMITTKRKKEKKNNESNSDVRMSKTE